MKPFSDREQLLVERSARRSRNVRALGLVLVVVGALLLLHLAWPFATLGGSTRPFVMAIWMLSPAWST